MVGESERRHEWTLTFVMDARPSLSHRMAGMERIIDKALVAAVCLALSFAFAFARGERGLAVVFFVAGIGFSAVFELISARAGAAAKDGSAVGTASSELTVACAGSDHRIFTAWCVTSAVVFGAAESGLAMLPLVAYDAARAGDASKNSHSAVTSAIWILPLAAWMATRSIPLFEAFCVAIACFGAALVSLRTTRLLDTEGRMRNLQDDLQDRLLDLDARNHELQAARGFEAREVALAERTRIARDIHDKVGHQLTRLSLQTKALQVVHAPDASVTADFGRIAAGLDDALDTMRKSVHDLEDDGVSLSVELNRLAGTSGIPKVRVACVLDTEPPADVTRCLVSVARESLTNAARHAHAAHASVRATEYPAFWQLVVRNDGVVPRGPAEAFLEAERSGGMGVRTMRESVASHGGIMRLICGDEFVVFVSIPKGKESDAPDGGARDAADRSARTMIEEVAE